MWFEMLAIHFNKPVLILGLFTLFSASSASAQEFISCPLNSLAEECDVRNVFLEDVSFSERSFAVLADWERLNGNEKKSAEIWRSLLKADDSQVRNWAALWLGIMDTTLSEEFPQDVPWGVFWSAIQKRYYAPWRSLEMLKSLNADTLPDVLVLLARYWRGLIFAQTKNADSAIVEWRKTLAQFPMNILAGEMLYRAGRLCFEKGDYRCAESLFCDALGFYKASNRKSVHWWADDAAYLQAISFIRQEEFDSARNVISYLKTISPHSNYVSTVQAILSAYGGAKDYSLDSIPSPFRAELLMRDGWKAFDSGKYRRAYMMFTDAYRAQPTQEAIISAAESAYKLKEYGTADSLYESITDGSLKSYALWGRGWCQLRMKNYDDARQLWSSIPQDTLFEDAVSFAIARSYYYQRDLAKAIDELGEYISNSGRRHRSAMVFLFYAQMESGDTSLAMETAARYLKRYPSGKTAGRIALAVAKAMFQRQNYGALIAWVDSTQKNFVGVLRDSLVLLSERGKYHSGEYADPIGILDGMIRRCPDGKLTMQLALDMGRQFERAHRWNDAIYVYSKAQIISLPGDSDWCEATLGVIRSQFELGDTVAAFASLRDIIFDGEQPWTSRGQLVAAKWIWKNIGDYERALQLCNDALKNANDAQVVDSATFDMAKLYFSAHKFAEARTAAETRWNEMQMDNPMAQQFAMLIAEAMWEQGLQDSAVDFCLNIADSLPNSCEFLLSVGNIALSQGRPELAGKIMDKISTMMCENIPANFLLQMGDAMVQLERITDACSLFALVVEQHPNDSLGEIARKRLKIFSLGKEKQ